MPLSKDPERRARQLEALKLGRGPKVERRRAPKASGVFSKLTKEQIEALPPGALDMLLLHTLGKRGLESASASTRSDLERIRDQFVKKCVEGNIGFMKELVSLMKGFIPKMSVIEGRQMGQKGIVDVTDLEIPRLEDAGAMLDVLKGLGVVGDDGSEDQGSEGSDAPAESVHPQKPH